MRSVDTSFEYGTGFEAGAVSGNLRLGKLEGYYEELFAEVIEDGVITTDERARLDRMADNLGLDRARLRKLEQALQAAYEARHQVLVLEQALEEAPPPRSLAPLEPATDARTLALERRVKWLETRVAELEKELEEAHASVAIDVELLAPVAGARVPEDDPVELARRARVDPRDAANLHALYRALAAGAQKDVERQACVAQALEYLGAATDEQKELVGRAHAGALIRPTAPVTHEGWTRLLFHPEEEPLVGEIFSVVAPAVLLGRLSALRRDKALPKLDPATKQDPERSTLQAVRCFAWGAAILGMKCPALHADPEFDGAAEMIPGVPPAVRLGRRALSGRSSGELAFLAGRHLALHREEHFVRLLVPNIADLEEIFLAALSVGNPGLPLTPHVRELVVPIARAIEPILEASSIDRLRGHFLRFVEEGGRTNLQRWAHAVDRTASRAGLLLAGDLRAAHAVFQAEDAARVAERMEDLLVFVTSDRYARLRRQIGVATA